MQVALGFLSPGLEYYEAVSSGPEEAGVRMAVAKANREQQWTHSRPSSD